MPGALKFCWKFIGFVVVSDKQVEALDLTAAAAAAATSSALPGIFNPHTAHISFHFLSFRSPTRHWASLDYHRRSQT